MSRNRSFNPGSIRRIWRTWNRRVVSFVLLVAVAVMAMNILVDPYQVFRVIAYPNDYAPNEWDNKFAWLREHPQQADILLLGSSRMGIYDPQWIEERLPGRKAYNFSKLAARPTDIARLLPALARVGLKPREIVLGIDIFPFLTRPRNRGPAHFDPPFITGKPRAIFLSQYLFLASFVEVAGRLMHRNDPVQKVIFHFSKGMYRVPGLVRKRALDPETYDRKEYAAASKSLAGIPLDRAELQALEAISNWVKEEGVVVHAFIHPHHPVIQAQVGQIGLQAFEAAVRQRFPSVTNLLHFTDHVQPDYYLDRKHYGPRVARKIVDLLPLGAPNDHFSRFSALSHEPADG